MIEKELRRYANPQRAKTNAWFFKTGEGEYGEGDRFLGLTVPEQRKIAKQYAMRLTIHAVKKLLQNPYHEFRLTALFILVTRYKKIPAEHRAIYEMYVRSTAHINNWDLVDSSAPYILGDYLYDRDKKILYRFARSKNLWKKRIALLATFGFIKKVDFRDAFVLTEILLHDTHDLIHKAVGWMLREIGNRDRRVEEAFLKKHYEEMPRTTLRYALEKFPKARKQAYLKGEIKKYKAGVL